MATAAQWVSGARPFTLPAAMAPVAAGTGAAAALDGASAPRALLALAVALALQIGVNFANDYSDGIRGTDAHRVGPFRLTGSGAARPRAVLAAALGAFGCAAAAGLALVALCGAWWLLAVGAACIPAAWFYTGGRRPYGYRALGEVFVFVFFGLVAVLGTTFAQAGRLSLPALCASVGVGALACAILVANNLRDLPTDAASGKRTLAVKLGDRATRRLYGALVAAAALVLLPVVPGRPWAALTFLVAPLAVAPLKAVLGGAEGRDLLPVLRRTGGLELAYGVVLGLALSL
ncbi:1,4-dihydroxy-2-naphthoate polyprenyltransferase [Mesoterricola silvestris]|uniref:1,4-dihydroxy-2-naphthoate octaprenyltransferase n=1 Tax=Mesoterricola silvestris TaxID=2927979 RepID=A0AA48GTL4_9BACT|nr:1,4-dihydroxy-2-naphthoate polyprenyltransferase [Mesoterricola silvestris]BDU74115.1 1,4-dihydroxy-2-naphthoate octaprenyltransferase [Mesoterricola silvestris]